MNQNFFIYLNNINFFNAKKIEIIQIPIIDFLFFPSSMFTMCILVLSHWLCIEIWMICLIHVVVCKTYYFKTTLVFLWPHFMVFLWLKKILKTQSCHPSIHPFSVLFNPVHGRRWTNAYPSHRQARSGVPTLVKYSSYSMTRFVYSNNNCKFCLTRQEFF